MDGLLTLPAQFLEDGPASRIGESPENELAWAVVTDKTIAKRLWIVKRKGQGF